MGSAIKEHKGTLELTWQKNEVEEDFGRPLIAGLAANRRGCGTPKADVVKRDFKLRKLQLSIGE